ncbi:MAG TPA: ABC transporter ATP-binding protein [Clostridiales bacterium]|nr:ABC transporter ATP-binding protein [Clostridiales bacterium]HQH63643.1 ABC transporter ATP-binding protein [Clostridiales bacterium]
MIEVIQMTKKYGTFTALSDVSFRVGKGSVYGLVGYNGAGKTTLLKTLAGVFKPDGGEVRIFGQHVFDNPFVKQKLFYVPDDLYFQPYANMDKMARFYRGYYPGFDMKTFAKLAEVFGLDTTKRINGFSKGMQRQAEMVLGLSTFPEVLLLDESFDGLDPAKRNMAKNLLMEYASGRDCCVVISSHNLHELGDMCDHIGLINGKKIVLDAAVDELSGSRSKFRAVFGGDISREDFEAAGIEVKRFAKDGKIITLSAGGSAQAIEERLRTLSPLLIEKQPLTLEEIFLEEMEGSDYDFSQIFG